MSDERLICVNCGRSFIWSHGEQRFYKERNLAQPKRCKECRATNAVRTSLVGDSTSATTAKLRSLTVPSGRHTKRLANPYLRYYMIGFGSAIILALLLWFSDFVTNGLTAWLVAINVVTVLLLGYDKAIIAFGWQRVPERVLLILALSFGTLGTVIGMSLFHHKTAKGIFQLKFWLIVAVQVFLLVTYFALVQP